jgi:hypothetical protein
MYSYHPGRENPHQHEMPGHCAAAVPVPHSRVCERFIYSQSICLFGCRKICVPILGMYKSPTDTRMRKCTQFPEKEYIIRIFIAVRFLQYYCMLLTSEYFRVDWLGLLWRAQQSHRSAERRSVTTD